MVVTSAGAVGLRVALAARAFVLRARAVRQGFSADGAPVALRAVLAEAVASHEDEEVAPVLLGQQGVETGVSAGV